VRAFGLDTLSLNLLAMASSTMLLKDVLRRRGFLGVHDAHDYWCLVLFLVGGISSVWFGALCRRLLTRLLSLVSGGRWP
jgi:hypothetical protein